MLPISTIRRLLSQMVIISISTYIRATVTHRLDSISRNAKLVNTNQRETVFLLVVTYFTRGKP